MKIIKEYFRKPEEDVYFYTATIFNLATGMTWHVQAVVDEKPINHLVIREIECTHLKGESEPFPDNDLILDEKCNLRDLLLKTVRILTKEERGVIT